VLWLFAGSFSCGCLILGAYFSVVVVALHLVLYSPATTLISSTSCDEFMSLWWQQGGMDNKCDLGDLASSTTLALIGDSHAMMWFRMFGEIGKRLKLRIKLFAWGVCAVCILFVCVADLSPAHAGPRIARNIPMYPCIFPTV
jgi:hypothetical protein